MSMFHRTLAAWAATLALWTPGVARPQDPGAAAKDRAPGLAVGVKAPDFRLKDRDGTERSLDEFTKRGKVALVFYRSADW